MKLMNYPYSYPLLNGDELRGSPTDSPRKVNIPIVAINEAIDIIYRKLPKVLGVLPFG